MKNFFKSLINEEEWKKKRRRRKTEKEEEENNRNEWGRGWFDGFFSFNKFSVFFFFVF